MEIDQEMTEKSQRWWKLTATIEQSRYICTKLKCNLHCFKCPACRPDTSDLTGLMRIKLNGLWNERVIDTYPYGTVMRY